MRVRRAQQHEVQEAAGAWSSVNGSRAADERRARPGARSPVVAAAAPGASSIAR